MRKLILLLGSIGLVAILLGGKIILHREPVIEEKLQLIDIGSIEDNREEITQKVLFAYEYTNWAYGYQHHVTFIDNEGYIKAYSYTGEWDLESSQGENWSYETAKELVEDNYAKATKVTRKIDQAELRKVYQLSRKVKDSEYSQKVSPGADQGQYTTYCYVLEGNSYKIIELGTIGDWIYRNLDPVAVTIDFWLRCDVFGEDRSYLEQQYNSK